MKIDGINGNVTAKGYEKWIELEELEYGLGRGITSHEAGHQSNRGASAPSFTELTITKEVDETSPNLFLETCTGKGKTVQIHFCETGDTIQSYLEFTFSDVLLTGYSFSGFSGDGRQPTERVSFNYTKIVQTYKPYDDKGAAGSQIAAGYDLIAAQKSS